MAWITDADLKDAVASVLRTTAGSLPASWTAKVAQANRRAYNAIRRLMMNKGYALADLDTWNERADFNEDCALCLLLRKAKLPDGVEGDVLAEFCKAWDELKDIGDILDEDGEVIPVTTTNTNLSFGSYDTTDDTFTMDTEF